MKARSPAGGAVCHCCGVDSVEVSESASDCAASASASVDCSESMAAGSGDGAGVCHCEPWAAWRREIQNRQSSGADRLESLCGLGLSAEGSGSGCEAAAAAVAVAGAVADASVWLRMCLVCDPRWSPKHFLRSALQTASWLVARQDRWCRRARRE